MTPRPRTLVVLFGLMAFSYAYFFNPLGWNQAAKVSTMRAIVMDHTMAINAYKKDTGDTIAVPVPSTDGASAPAVRFYSNKPPGTVFLGLPAWALAHAVFSRLSTEERALMFAQYFSTILAVGLPGAALVVLLFSWLARVTERPVLSLVVSIGLGLGTLVFPFATMHYSHVTAAALLFAAFYLFWSFVHLAPSPRRGNLLVCAAAALCTFSVIVEYSAAPPAFFIFVYGAMGVWTCGDAARRRSALMALAAVAVLTGVPLLAYNMAVSGRLLFVTYGAFRPGAEGGFRFSLDPIVTQIHWPSGAALKGVLFGRWRGLFVGSPWLLWAALGSGLMAVRRPHRPEAALFLVIFLFHLFCNTVFGNPVGDLNDFWGGEWSCGPRHMTTVLPFLVAGAAFFPRGAVVGVPLMLWSVFLMLVATSVDPRFDPRLPDPFFNYALGVFSRGDVGLSLGLGYLTRTYFGGGHGWNLGRVAGLHGSLQLVPLYVVWVAAVGLLLRDLRSSEPPFRRPLL